LGTLGDSLGLQSVGHCHFYEVTDDLWVPHREKVTVNPKFGNS